MTALLTLMHWLSPAFPTGAFAYGHGLERAIASGEVTEAASMEPSMEHWLRNILTYGTGWQDALLLCAALAEDADHASLDALARALQPSAERLRESAEQGAALARTIAGIAGRALPARLLPVTLGEAAAPLALPPALVAQLYLQGFAGNLCTIAIRAVPLGQTEGQAILARLLPVIAGLGARGGLGPGRSRHSRPRRRSGCDATRNPRGEDLSHMTRNHGPLRVGIGGPVGAGRTTLTEKLARALGPRLSMAVITNDIYSREDAEALMRAGAAGRADTRGRDRRLPAYGDPRGSPRSILPPWPS